MINPMDLSGKQYIVTGASSGLGRQACITLCGLGAMVFAVARNTEKLGETVELCSPSQFIEGGGTKPYSCDLSNIDSIEKLVKDIVQENGKLDGLVHCAGIGTMKPLSSTTYSFLDEMMRINVYAFIELTRHLTKKKNCNQNFSIVAVSSAASIRGDKAKTAYCMSKGALDSACQALAAELGQEKKIRVNTVNPGWIKTQIYFDYVKDVGQEYADAAIRNRQFLGIAEPCEVSNVIAFLLSDASSQITGQSIVVDGGRTIW